MTVFIIVKIQSRKKYCISKDWYKFNQQDSFEICLKTSACHKIKNCAYIIRRKVITRFIIKGYATHTCSFLLFTMAIKKGEYIWLHL